MCVAVLFCILSITMSSPCIRNLSLKTFSGTPIWSSVLVQLDKVIKTCEFWICPMHSLTSWVVTGKSRHGKHLWRGQHGPFLSTCCWCDAHHPEASSHLAGKIVMHHDMHPIYTTEPCWTCNGCCSICSSVQFERVCTKTASQVKSQRF